MFKKILVGLLAAALIFLGPAGSLFADDRVNDKILMEFRTRSVVDLANGNMIATGYNYQLDDADKIDRKHPHVAVWIRMDDQITLFITLFGKVSQGHTVITEADLPDTMRDNPVLDLGHHLLYVGSMLFYVIDEYPSAAIHVRLFHEFVAQEYQDGQRP